MTRRLSILSVCRGFPTPTDPSAGIFVLNRVEAMARQADVRVIQPIPYFPLIAPLPGWARGPSRRQRLLEIEHAPMFYLPGILKRFDGAWLARAIRARSEAAHRQRSLDLIDAHFGYPEGAGCVRLGRRLGVPVFITVRGFEHEYVHSREVGPPMITALRTATGCIAVSHSLRELALAQGVEPDRVKVVHNAVDSQVFHFVESDSARRKLGLDPAQALIVSIGHLISRKRHHVLIEAFARARTRHPGTRLALIGAGSFEPDYPDRLRKLVRDLGLERDVEFLGNLEPAAVADWLAAADVFALATAREGCCNAVLEALAVGVPVVTTPVGDNAHFVEVPFNGLLAPVDDVSAFADAIDAVLTGRIATARKAIADELHRQVGRWDDVAARVLDFFNERLAVRDRTAREQMA